MKQFKIIKAGLHTTIQDKGRRGWRHLGVPQSGAMDVYALQLANYLVDNPLDAPAIELTLKGGAYFFEQEAIIALTGALMPIYVNGVQQPNNQSLLIAAGDELQIGFAKEGVYAYLAIQGRLKGQKEMNSVATYTLAKLGGYQGRALQKEDCIQWENENIRYRNKYVDEHLQIRFPQHQIVRFLKGPEWSFFTSESQASFLQNKFQILPQSNRMGIRLKGETIGISEHKMLSSAVLAGSIQITKEGQPIVLMKDGQTTGGYARIGKVVEADLGRMAQSRRPQKISFRSVDLREAKQLQIHQNELLGNLLLV